MTASPVDFRSRIITPTDSGEPPALTVALTGDSGEGKSTGAFSFPNSFAIYADANTGKLGSCPYISVGGEAGYRVFEKEILPAINARDEKTFGAYSTIILDSFSFLQGDLRDTIPDLDDDKKTRGAYAQLKRDTTEPLRKLTKLAIAPRPGAKVWNVVVTCHLQPSYKVFKQGRGEQEQVLDKYEPMLEGGARGKFSPYFNTVLLLKSEPVSQGNNPDGSPRPSLTRYFAYSKPPDRYYFCKDSVGGPPGKWAKLPTKMDWTDRSLYEVLAAGWGFPEVGK